MSPLSILTRRSSRGWTWPGNLFRSSLARRLHRLGADLTAEVPRSSNSRWPGNLAGLSLRIKQTFGHRHELILKPATATSCAIRLAGLCKPGACVSRLYCESPREMSGTDGTAPASLGRSHWGEANVDSTIFLRALAPDERPFSVSKRRASP